MRATALKSTCLCIALSAGLIAPSNSASQQADCDSSNITSTVLVMDASSSIDAPLLSIIKAGVKQFITGIQPDSLNRVGILVFPGFESSPDERILPLTGDRQRLFDFVDGVTTKRGTPMNEALLNAIDMLVLDGIPAAQQIIVYTDGEADTDDKPLQNIVIENAQQAAINIYTIAVGPNADRDALQEIASQTDGEFFVAGQDDLARLLDINRKLSDKINLRYDLDLTIMGDRTRVMPGEEFRYKFLIRNNGPETAHDIEVSAQPSPYLDVLYWPGIRSGDLLFYHIDSLAATESDSILLYVSMPLQLFAPGSSIITSASVSTLCQNEVSLSNNSVNDSITIIQPSLSLYSTVDKQNINANSDDIIEQDTSFVYTLTVTNNSVMISDSFSVVNILPEFVTALAADPEPDTPIGESELEWRFGDLPSGDQQIIELTCVIQIDDLYALCNNTPAPDSLALENISWLLSDTDSTLNQYVTANVSLVDYLDDLDELCRSDVTVAISVHPINPEKGEPITYTISIDNDDSRPAHDLLVECFLPDSLTVLERQPLPEGWQTESGSDDHHLVWSAAEMPADSEALIEFQVIYPDSRSLNNPPLELNTDVYLSVGGSSAGSISIPLLIQSGYDESCDQFYFDVNVVEPARMAGLFIHYYLSTDRTVSMNVLDMSGSPVRTLIGNESRNAGDHTVLWDGTDNSGGIVGSGVYIVTMDTNSIRCWKKVIVRR